MIAAVFRRRLKPGVTFQQFLEAWGAERGFGVPTRVFNAVRLDDEREVLSVGFVAVDAEGLARGMADAAAQEAVRHDRIDELLESTELRAMYEVETEHDLTDLPRAVALGSDESLLGPLS